jgi:hypothetical protein
MEEAVNFTSNFAKVPPRDIMNTVRSDYGIGSAFATVWKVLTRKKFDSMEYDESYILLKQYCNQFESLNPGTVTSLEFDSDGVTFHRASFVHNIIKLLTDLADRR